MPKSNIKYFHTKEEFRKELNSRPLHLKCEAGPVRCKDKDCYNPLTGSFDIQIATQHWCSTCLFAEVHDMEVRNP